MQIDVKGGGKSREVHKREDNDWTYMKSSPPITTFFVLHILPSFQPFEHQFIVQPTPQRLMMVDLALNCGVSTVETLQPNDTMK